MRYPIVNKVTGERKEIERSCHDILEWYEENPDWERDWGQGCATEIGGVGEWKTTNVNKNPGWKDVLDKVRKVPGNTLAKDNLY
tara:strand:+ start:43 stop:294 length:252 start_codon:yes stop_codon:yes gene_type:complete